MLSLKLVDGFPNIRPSILEIANIEPGSGGLLLKVPEEVIGSEDVVCRAELVALCYRIVVHLFVDRKKLFEQGYLVSIVASAFGEDEGYQVLFGNRTGSFLLQTFDRIDDVRSG